MTQAESLVDIAASLANVSRMRRPLNLTQAQALLQRFPFDEIALQLQKMDNYAAITKSLSVYLTILKWFEMDIRKGFYKPGEIKKKTLDPTVAAKKSAFLRAHPVGSEFQGQSGKRWSVKSPDLVFCHDDKMIMELDIILAYSGIPP
jgi:hypothetical protein